MLGGAERWADCTGLYSSWQKVWLWRKEMSCLCQHFTDLEPKLPVLIHCILNVILSDSEARTHASLCFCCFAFLLWTWPSFCPRLCPSSPHPSCKPQGAFQLCLHLSFRAMALQVLLDPAQDPTSCTLLSHVASNLSSSLPQELGQRQDNFGQERNCFQTYSDIKEHPLCPKPFAVCCIIKYSLYKSSSFLFNSFVPAS